MAEKQLEDMTEPELAALMTACAKAVDGVFKAKGLGRGKFALVVFDDPLVAQYISTCRREDMVAAMRATADRIERKAEVRRD